MEALSFVLQRFSYSLFSGCIINFFLLLNYFVMVKIKFLPENFFKDISFPDSVNFLIFIITAVIFSIFVEGICEIFVQKYTELYNEKKVWTPKLFKRDKNRRTFYSFLLWNISRKITVLEASSYYSKENSNNGDAMREFMRNTDCKIPYEAVYNGAKKIIRKEKNQNIYHFRDLSFILQLLRVSFALISVISFIAGTVFLILWLSKENEAHKTLSIFYLVSFCVSLIAIFPTDKMTIYFSRRYVRDVWRTYKAMQKKKE